MGGSQINGPTVPGLGLEEEDDSDAGDPDTDTDPDQQESDFSSKEFAAIYVTHLIKSVAIGVLMFAGIVAAGIVLEAAGVPAAVAVLGVALYSWPPLPPATPSVIF